jgi:hypothetical protein
MSDRWVVGLVSEMIELPLPKRLSTEKTPPDVRRVRFDRYEGTANGHSSHDVLCTLHADGAMHFSEAGGEGFIYLYPDQVEHLKKFLSIK